MTRRYHACIHEGSHAFAAWYFGFPADFAVVFHTRRSAPVGTVMGLVRGIDIHLPHGPAEITFENEATRERYLWEGITLAEISLIVLVAGVSGESRHTKKSRLGHVLGGGADDYKRAAALADTWLPSRREAFVAAHRRASALIRSTKGWAAILSLAGALLTKGRIESDEIDSLCRAAYGSEPDFFAWVECWPPTLEQLRAGHVPHTAKRA
ncbi:MAG: hypothetical protein ABSA13_03450 [Beijerinckiaceae bacterium]|jgi:hypothetical protein